MGAHGQRAPGLLGNLPPNCLTQYPTGRWGFAGRVDMRLSYGYADGRDLDQEMARKIQQFGPGLFRPQVVTRTWDTRDEALEAARAIGQVVTK